MRLLFATDGSAGADVALEFLLALPLSSADQVTVLTVPVYSFMGTDRIDPTHTELIIENAEDAASAVAERARARLDAHGVGTAVEVLPGPVVTAAERLALEQACDVIVLGSRGLGAFAGSLLGSVARALARHATTPVLVVRERPWAPQRILVAVDGSEEGRSATALMARFPLPSAAVFERLEIGPDDVERGIVAQLILTRAATSGVDLVAIGLRGQTAGTGLLAGSVVDRVLSHAHCAVLVAKSPLATRSVADEARPLAKTALAL